MQDLSDPVTLPAGAVLFDEGSIGHCAYLILSGRIAIFRRRDGGETVLARRGAGEIFGEMAILDALPRSAGARAEADCVLVPVSAAQIQQRLAGADPILRLCLEGLIARFRETLPRLGPAVAEGLRRRCRPPPAPISTRRSRPSRRSAPCGGPWPGTSSRCSCSRSCGSPPGGSPASRP